MTHASLPSHFWSDIFSSVIYLINRLPHTSSSTSPFFSLFQTAPDYNLMRTLGCLCFPLVKPYNDHKLQPRALPCVFIGYPIGQKGYKCYQIDTNKTFVSRHVTFDEATFPFSQSQAAPMPSDDATSTNTWLPPLAVGFPLPARDSDRVLSNTRPQPLDASALDLVSPASIHPSNFPAQTSSSSDRAIYTPSPSSPATPIIAETSSNTTVHPMITRTRDNTRRPRIFPDHVAYVSTLSPEHEPTSFAKAKVLPQWQSAMQSEIEALSRNQTWSLVPRPPNHNIVGCKWVYRIKQKPDGSIDRYKARLVAKGFSQEEGVDYYETFSPVVRPSTIRIVLSLALSKQWSIRQLDVQNAFLHGDLHETVYMQQPPGFIDQSKPDHVCLLHKALYGLKQSPRAWFQTLSSSLIAYGFVASRYDPSLFIFHANGQFMVILVYVDDIVLTGSSDSLLSHLVSTLQKSFAIKDLGDLHFFLGIEVTRVATGMYLSQHKYISDLLFRANMHNARSCPSPMASHSSLSKFDGDPHDNPHHYRTIVGALQYATITRPDIAFAVNKVSQFMHNPTTSHWSAVKRILRYLVGSTSHGLFLRSDSPLSLHAFSDSNWAGCPDDRRSTSAYCIYLGSNLVSWSSKKQPTVARSSTEAEYRSLALGSAELIWVQFILLELHVKLSAVPTLWCDNLGATFLASTPMFNARTKHIEIDYHFVREQVVARKIQLGFLPSKEQVADALTKPLGTPRFLLLRPKLTVLSNPLTCRGGVKEILEISNTIVNSEDKRMSKPALTTYSGE